MATKCDAPAVWLRDNCPCARCRHPGSGQKLVGLADLPDELHVTELTEADGQVRVRFAPDGHEAVFDARWLARWWAEAAAAPEDQRTEDAKTTWTAAELNPLPEADWARYRADPATRRQALTDVLRLGFVVLRGVPPEPGTVLRVAGTFGFVRQTNYGELFDVRVEPAPVNLAFTALPILPHTDNPYRDPVPTIQVLHCLHNAARGGDSGLVDGFRAAADLRATDPAAFELLTGTAVTFRFAAADADLAATRPMIGLNPYGRIREIRLNHRSLAPVRLPPADTRCFYAAYRSFTALVNRPGLRVDLHLTAGDCLVFDNTRLLHARTGFDGPPGERHLQGCYADLDGLASTVALLGRTTS